MKFDGMQKLTLLDFPGKVAATLFFGGCNFRCPFCHNGHLVTEPTGAISSEEILSFLKKRTGILEGVCITGGEPLLQSQLVPFLEEVKAMGYAVKLDTNGSFPQKLKDLVGRGLVDYVAMDIKNSPNGYGKTAGIPNLEMAPILESVAFLLEGTVDYEFRTTVVQELHTAQDFEEISQWIAGAKAYFLQGFVDSGDLLQEGLHGWDKEQMEQFRDICKATIPTTELRGL